jgi:hypothetical protein
MEGRYVTPEIISYWTPTFVQECLLHTFSNKNTIYFYLQVPAAHLFMEELTGHSTGEPASIFWFLRPSQHSAFRWLQTSLPTLFQWVHVSWFPVEFTTLSTR